MLNGSVSVDKDLMDMDVPDGDLSPEQAAAWLDSFMNDDADEKADDASGQDEQPKTEDETPEQEPEQDEQPETPTVDEVAALRAEIEALKAAQQMPKAADAPTSVEELPESVQELAGKSGLSDDELLEKFGDFSEKSIAKAVQELVAISVAAEMKKALLPIQEKEQQAAQEAHYQAILAAHPDAGELANGRDLQAWVDTLPSYAKGGVQAVLEKGSAAEVIEVLNDFKAATGRGQAKQPEKQPETKKAKVPDTLSQIPTGRSGTVNTDAHLADLPPDVLAEKLSEMSPEQVERYLNSL